MGYGAASLTVWVDGERVFVLSFGFITNTGVRMILVLDATSAASLKDQEIRLIFKRFHGHYCNTISNPFYEIGTPMQSKWFDEGIRDLYSISE
ncbi:hypothetical protein GCK72_008517 [Caenorhabditis remanei]|uniref:Uncharacterized protein n=1 Tax=Caenorhabditis remanei TaxID=31234 RepID=A0A6A5GZY0_CAERE|nr:hypothetical protein GCK72_008517 [Caenorhabditis remanei]KAF1760271.1 hypothetical protein GCK72_008517 [Caenorhabditis remanei]